VPLLDAVPVADEARVEDEDPLQRTLQRLQGRAHRPQDRAPLAQARRAPASPRRRRFFFASPTAFVSGGEELTDVGPCGKHLKDGDVLTLAPRDGTVCENLDEMECVTFQMGDGIYW
jgi:hypothetical protein